MEEIGRGSFATVYKAVHVVCSRPSTQACLACSIHDRMLPVMLQSSVHF